MTTDADKPMDGTAEGVFDDVADIEQMLELAALHQRFAEPDDELSQVLRDCTRGSGQLADSGDADEKGQNAPVAPHQLPAGTLLGGHYVIEGVLGQGGFGITYVGRDTVLDTKVAIKEFYPHGYVSRDASYASAVSIVSEKNADFVAKGRERFLQEARTLAKFDNQPGIVDVRGYFEENDTAYIVMEYLDGVDLRQHLSQSLPFEAADFFRRLGPVMDALERIHEAGMLHRDVSPDNIMLLPDGSLKLMDFGAARAVDAEAPHTISLVLKPGYAPEEQYLPKGNQGPWTDIYALCATAYKCITGSTPHDALRRGSGDEHEWPSELGFKISEREEAVLKRGMSVEPKDRFQSIDAMRRALAGEEKLAETEESVTAPKPAPGASEAVRAVRPGPTTVPAATERIASKRQTRSRKVIAAVAAVVVALVVGIAAAALAFTQPKLSATELSLVVDAEAHVTLEHAQEDVEWRVDDKHVIEISARGNEVVVFGKHAGTATLMAVHEDKLYECAVLVDAPKLSKTKVALEKGRSIVLELGGTEQEAEWASSDSSVVEVSMTDGNKATITAKKVGRATVTATVCGVKYECKVTASTADAASGGGSSTSHAVGGSSHASGTGDVPDASQSGSETDSSEGEDASSQSSSTGDESSSGPQGGDSGSSTGEASQEASAASVDAPTADSGSATATAPTQDAAESGE